MTEKQTFPATLNHHVSYNAETRQYEIIDLETGEIVGENQLRSDAQRYRFNTEVGILICQRIRKGDTLTAIGEDPQMPPLHIIQLWRKHHPYFDEQVLIARQDRAEGYHDKIVEMANDLADDVNPTKEQIAAKKVAMDAFKWAAEKNDNKSFGKKQEVHQTSEVATTIVVNTGIDRTPLPDVVVTKEEQ